MSISRKLITDACVLSVDPNVGDFARADILIEGEKIVAIGPDIQADDVERIEARHMIAVPGFVDTHRHSWQSVLRGITSDMTFMGYFLNVLPVHGRLFRPEDKYAGVLASALMSLDAGVTTMVDFGIAVETPEDSDASIQALKESGSRAFYCHGVSADLRKWFHNSDLRHPAAEAHRVRSQHFSANDGLVRFGMALRGPVGTTPAANRADFALARELDAPITVHIDGPGELTSMRDYMGPDTCYVHCCRSTDEELMMVRDSGGHISVSLEGEMAFHNAPVTKRILELGMKPSFSIDGGGSYSTDMFIQMRMGLQELRMRHLEEHWSKTGSPLMSMPYTSRDALAWGTIDGARQFGLEDVVGTLTPGKQADIVLIRYDSLHMSPMNYPHSMVVETASPRDVDTVLVAGEIKKRDGKLVGVDIERVRKMLYESRDYVFQKVGVPECSALHSAYFPAVGTVCTCGTPSYGRATAPASQMT